MRWQTLRLQGLCDGTCTAAGRLFADQQRQPQERSEAMLHRFRQAIESSLGAREQTEPLPLSPRIGEISAAGLLAYLDFRWPGWGWRTNRTRLAGWLAAMERRPSLQQTRYALPAHSAELAGTTDAPAAP